MRRRKIWWLVRGAVGVVGLVGLVLFIEPARVWDSLSDVSIALLLLAFGWQLLAKLVWAWRWKAVLAVGGIRRSFWNLLALLHVGLFFNVFLPSGAGGDVVRGWYTSRDKVGRIVGFASVLFERLLGFVTLMLLAALASGVELLRGPGRLPAELLLWVLAASSGIVGLGFTILVLDIRLPEPLENWFQRKFPDFHAKLAGARAAWRAPQTPRTLIFSTSLALQVIGVFWYITTARAIHMETPASFFFFLMPAAAIVSMLPVSPGGAGVREWTLVGLLAAYGVPEPQAGAFALLAFAISMTFALVGGLIYPFYRTPEDAATSGNDAPYPPV